MTASVDATPELEDRPTPPVPAATARGGRPPWLLPAGVGLAAGIGLLYTSWQDPNTSEGAYPLCPSFSLFGIDCPGCGGLRATHALTNGDVVAAFDHNLVITLLWPIAVVAWVLWLLHSLGVRAPRFPEVDGRWWWVIGPALLLFTVARNLPFGGVFEYLAATA